MIIKDIFSSGRKYDVIYADPPWQYKDKLNCGNRGAEHKYSCMDYNSICAMPVHSIAADDCLLGMWWVGPMAKEAFTVVESWGFDIITMTGFSWAKTTVNGKWHFGMGHWTRGNVENVLFARRGSPKRKDAGVSQFIPAMFRGHSVKPDAVGQKLRQLMYPCRMLEMFARRDSEMWDTWGMSYDFRNRNKQ